MTTALKEVALFIRQQIATTYYGRPEGPAAMRDGTYSSNESYRQMEDACAKELQRLGGIELWKEKKNERPRLKLESGQLWFEDYAGAPASWRDLKTKAYIPKAQEAEETEEGSHLEPENMTYEQHGRASAFYFRKAGEVAKRGEAHRQVQVYYDAMGIPHEMTLKQWRENGFKAS